MSYCMYSRCKSMPCKSETAVAGGDVAEAVAADVDGCVAMMMMALTMTMMITINTRISSELKTD